MIKIYLLAWFFSVLFCKRRIINFFLIFLVFLINLILNNFFKKIDSLWLNLFKYNNFYWDYVAILNNNNKSFLFFLLIILYLTIYDKINFKSSKTIFLVFFGFLYTTKIVTLNSNNFVFNFNIINTNLINGLILIHPLFIYIFYSFLFTLILNFVYEKFISKKIRSVAYKNNFVVIFSFLALFLGSYWSQQELNWGGWWNWDFVELIALIFFLVSVLILHIKPKNNLNYFFMLFFKILNYFIIFFFLIRLDIINSIHSFSSFNSSSFNINILFSLYIIFTIIVVFNNNYGKYYVNSNIKNNNVLTLLFLMLLLIFNIFIYINIIISFFYNTQFIELTKNLKVFLNLIVLLFFIYLIKNKKLLSIAVLTAILNSFIIFYISILIIIIKIINNYKYNYKNIFHIFIIIFIIVNNFYYNYQYWYINFYSILSNKNLLNNINLLYDFQNHTINLYCYNNNNYLIILNNYYCYNNNILFNNVFRETLLNNMLLSNKNLTIFYLIDKSKILFNFKSLYLFFVYTLFILYKKCIDKKKTKKTIKII